MINDSFKFVENHHISEAGTILFFILAKHNYIKG